MLNDEMNKFKILFENKLSNKVRTARQLFESAIIVKNEDNEDGNLVKHAIYELSLLAEDEDDCDMQDFMNKGIIDVVRIFSKQGHSGFSAGYAVGVIEKLLRFEPLGPLTGENHEWNDISEYCCDETMYQNRRCSHIFKRADGTAYDINAKVFVEPDGSTWTNGHSHVDIEFPYVPKVEYIKVDSIDDLDNNDYLLS